MRLPEKARSRSRVALPTLFTVGTLFCGYYTLVQTLRAMALPASRAAEAAVLLDYAAIAIGIAMLTDGLDGRVARLAKAESEFGGELDSLADCITFGAGPALLAYAWGVHGAMFPNAPVIAELLPSLGYFCSFLFLTCNAVRLARFNVQKDPRPLNPGKSHRAYFVGMPSPPAAGLLGSVIHFSQGRPIEHWWPGGFLWCGLLACVGLLMISRWRYRSFKELTRLREPAIAVVLFATMIFLIWNFSRPVLLTMASTFAVSGVIARILSLFRQPAPEVAEGAALEASGPDQ